MKDRSVYSKKQYLTKVINTFFPKILFNLSVRKNWAKQHWGAQRGGDIHGYDKYCDNPHCFPALIQELNARARKEDSILDLGCNCGAYLNLLKREGYMHLSGVDISREAVEYGKKSFDLDSIDLEVGSFEEVLPRWIDEGKSFDHIYTIGATVELVHPSFDIVRSLSRISRQTIILFINEWGHAYPRFWEYEFNRNGFVLVKCIRPWRGDWGGQDFRTIDSLLVFRRLSAE